MQSRRIIRKVRMAVEFIKGLGRKWVDQTHSKRFTKCNGQQDSVEKNM